MAAALLGVPHFALIHGACHGSWAWYRLEDQLQKAGHNVSSMDMTGAGINLADPDTITTWKDYNKPAVDFFQSLPKRAPNEKVVLVGHRVGGGLINLMLMERFSHKIDFAVFVAAVVAPSGVVLLQDSPLQTLNSATSFYIPTSKLPATFYNGLDSEIFVLASKLVRPYRMLATPITYTKEKYGQVPAVYIRHMQDHALAPAAQE